MKWLERLFWWRRAAVRADQDERDTKVEAVAQHANRVADRINESADRMAAEYRRAEQVLRGQRR